MESNLSARELAERFIAGAPKFAEDLAIGEIDNKHRAIVTAAYEQLRGPATFSWNSFRNWSAQSDHQTPAQISREAVYINGLIPTLARYLYLKTWTRFQDACTRSSLLDDIEILNRIGARQLLEENPVSRTPGVKYVYCWQGLVVNQRWARYIYFLKRILDSGVLDSDSTWVDVGSYYGGLQGLVKKYRPDARIVLVDFHHQLCRSYVYLSKLYPAARHILPEEVAAYRNFDQLPPGAIMYVPVAEFDTIRDNAPALATNFFSFGEMRRSHFEAYTSSRLFRSANVVYLANRFVSAPFFEPTYDSDLKVFDYFTAERQVEYFDIYPMHHYSLINREVLGRKFFRNISSPYFELRTRKSPHGQAT